MFETRGTIDESALQRLFAEMMPKWYKVVQQVPTLLLFALAAHATLTKQYLYAGVYLIFAMLCLSLTRGKIRNEAKRMIERMRKITGKQVPEYLTRFEEDGVCAEAVGTKTSALVPYHAITRKVETKDFLLLFTQKEENIFVFKNQLDTAAQAALSAFLDEKIPGLKQHSC